MFKIKRSILSLIMATFILTLTITISYALKQDKIYQDQVRQMSVVPIDSTLKSNRYTQKDDLSLIDNNPYVTVANHEYLGTHEATNLSLYVHPEYLSLRVVNETTGYVWGSNMDHDYLEEGHPLYDPNNPQTNIRQDNSPVSISYYNTSLTTSVRTNEYFYEGAFTGTFVRQNLVTDIGFQARIKMPRSGISFNLIVYLNDEGLNVEIPFESVRDNGSFLLSTITIYRNFGFTTRDLTPGYVFIPDGSGALIRYDETYNKAYSKRFYGQDPTLNTPTLERALTSSVYGSVQGINQHGMMVILDKGAANATLTYQSHSQNMMFNKLYTTFEYRDKYIQRLNASGTSTIELIQAYMNTFDIHYIYKFLSGDDANYVGFANTYRRHLQSKGFDIDQIDPQDDINLHLDILALENKRVWYGRELIKMTQTHDIKDMVTSLNNEGIDQIVTTIHGWQKNGLSRTSPSFGSVDGSFGKLSILEDLNIKTYYALTPTLGYPGNGSYHANDIVRNQGSEFIKIGDYYLLNPSSALNILQKNYNQIRKQGIENISFEALNILYSDHHQLLSRSEEIPVVQSYFDVAPSTIVSGAFDYMFSADIIKEVEIYSSSSIVFTDTVPFITLVLQGHKMMFGRSANFFANTQNELLRMVDYGIYPNFYVSNESAQLLLNTDSSNIYTSKFSDWSNEIIRQYHYLNEGLKHVIGAHVVKREVIQPGFVLNTYSNGVKIYVNYSGHSYIHVGHTIPMMSYEVIL